MACLGDRHTLASSSRDGVPACSHSIPSLPPNSSFLDLVSGLVSRAQRPVISALVPWLGRLGNVQQGAYSSLGSPFIASLSALAITDDDPPLPPSGQRQNSISRLTWCAFIPGFDVSSLLSLPPFASSRLGLDPRRLLPRLRFETMLTSGSLSLLLLSVASISVAKTVSYNWDVSWVRAAPDGFARPVIGINGQWPCPPIIVDAGDTVVVNLNNHLGNETTGLHFHGIDQIRTPDMDGPSGVTQCPVPPGSSVTYSFVVCYSGFNSPGASFKLTRSPITTGRFPRNILV